MNCIKQRQKRGWFKAIVTACVVFAGAQLVPVRRTNPPVTTDMIVATAAPETEAKLLRAACYDCHSYETRWPWYASVAPVSWWTVRHVREGREHLNFSDWPQTKPYEAKAKLESIAHALREDTMPLKDYRLMHAEARLSNQDRSQLAAWAETNAASLPP